MSLERNRRAIVPAAVVLTAAAIFAVVPPAAAQTWPVIPEDERTMTDCPQQPGAEAIWLYREEITDVEVPEIRVYKRLKILKDSGRDHANIEIPYLAGSQKVADLEIRHIPPTGEPKPFRGQVFDKTAVRYRRLRIALKTFAVPDVAAGSIVEFRYRIARDTGGGSGKDEEEAVERFGVSAGKPEEGGLPQSREFLSVPVAHWDLQERLFTRRAKFQYIPHPQMGVLFDGPYQLSWSAQKIGTAKPETKGKGLLLEIGDLPAFEEEELMTPPEAERMAVDALMLARSVFDREDFWKKESQSWQKAAEKFIGDPRKVLAKAEELIEDVEDPTFRLKRLYDGVQKIRNLSYEKGLTRARMKEQKIKANRGVADVLERGYGVRSDITRTFVALARAAGFDAEPVRVSTRDDKLFNLSLMSFYGQMDSEAALVKAGGKTMLFDPATPFCPFGLVHWSRSNAAAIGFSDKPPAIFTTPVYPPEMAMTQRQAALALDAQGTLAGTVKMTYSGHEALVRRLEHLNDDAESRKKGLEKELADILPMGASVALTKIENADNSAPALTAHFEISVPGFATTAGDKTLLAVLPLTGSAQYPFRHAERRYPVYFPYPYREFDDIVIRLPEGLAAEVVPAARKDANDFSAYSLGCIEEGPRRLHVQRDLSIKKSYFPVEQYKDIKAFFDAARASDEAQVVLTVEK